MCFSDLVFWVWFFINEICFHPFLGVADLKLFDMFVENCFVTLSVCVLCLTRKFLQFCRASIIVKLAFAIPVRWRVGSNVDQRGCGRLQGLPLARLASFLAKELLIGHNVVRSDGGLGHP